MKTELVAYAAEQGDYKDDGNLVGHLFISYPNENDDSIVRFGFVIVDPILRGCIVVNLDLEIHYKEMDSEPN